MKTLRLSLARRALLAALCGLAALLSACPQLDACPCPACTTAIALSVFDDDGVALDDNWVVEASLDGEPLGEPEACAVGVRDRNTCAFGLVGGIYHLVIRARGFESEERLVRLAAARPDACCANGCVRERSIDVHLRRLAP